MTVHKFAFVAEGDVFTVWTFNSESTEEGSSEEMAMIIAGMSSNPKIVEITTDQKIGLGWTYNGTEFEAPKE